MNPRAFRTLEEVVPVIDTHDPSRQQRYIAKLQAPLILRADGAFGRCCSEALWFDDSGCTEPRMMCHVSAVGV